MYKSLVFVVLLLVPACNSDGLTIDNPDANLDGPILSRDGGLELDGVSPGFDLPSPVLDLASPPNFDLAHLPIDLAMPPLVDLGRPTVDLAQPPRVDLGHPPLPDLGHPPLPDLAQPPPVDMSEPAYCGQIPCQRDRICRLVKCGQCNTATHRCE